MFLTSTESCSISENVSSIPKTYYFDQTGKRRRKAGSQSKFCTVYTVVSM